MTPSIPATDGTQRNGGATALAPAAIFLLAAIGCESYRVEYHPRPGYYRSAAMGELPDQITLDDGTIIVFGERPLGRDTKQAPDDDRERFQIRQEQEDGSIILRALVPQDVLGNTLTCLRNEEYELLWEQLVSQQTKRAYEQDGQGFEEFAVFFRTHRADLAATLTRMLLGIPRHEVFLENIGAGVIRSRFHPHVAKQFKFKTAEVISEPAGLRLLMIR